ncbi:hypothetical protein CI109_101813 [Kwoniella shandongensis]|uniref:RRM domain-containing protein n=1 Tax=Kwoniella shandongensis TaxID=1734106 RepID=A0AAJ8LGE7_9TREE
MDFSSANVPISRDTWAPRSPSPERAAYAADPYAERPPPPPRGDDLDAPAPRAPGSANGAGNGSNDGYRDDRDSYRGGRDEYRGDRDRGDAYPPAPPRRPPHAPPAAENNVLGVFGLSIRTAERDLEEEFMRYGDVERVVIVYDKTTDRSRGFGFITMRTIEDAKRCIEKLNGLNLHGRNIRVDFSATQKPHAPTPGEYRGVKRPINDDRYGGRGGGGGGRYDDRRGGGYEGRGRGYDDRRGGDRYDDRDRYRDRDDGRSFRRRDDDDPYGGRSRREEPDRERRRSVSPRRSRYSGSPDRRPPPRDYDAPPPAAAAPPPAPEPSRY